MIDPIQITMLGLSLGSKVAYLEILVLPSTQRSDGHTNVRRLPNSVLGKLLYSYVIVSLLGPF